MRAMGGSGPGRDAPPNNTHDALHTALGIRNYRQWMSPANVPVKPGTPNTPNTPNTILATTTTAVPRTARRAGRPASLTHATTTPSTTPTLPTPPLTHNGPHGDYYYNPLHCTRPLDAYLANLSNAPAYSFDSKRLHVLRTALDTNDFAYLTMHQYYTLHTYYAKHHPSSSPFPHLSQQPNLLIAFDIMRFVVQSNDLLSPQCLRFCASFPHPLEYLQKTWPLAFLNESRAFVALVQHSANFDTVRVDCETRGFGPLAHELVHSLGIVSSTFQMLVFTAISRRIHSLNLSIPAHNQFEERLLDLFRQSQANLTSLSARHPGWYTSRQNWDTEVRLWGSRLLGLATAFIPLPRTHSLSHRAQAINQRAHPQRIARTMPSPKSPLPSQLPRRVPLLPRPGWSLPQQRVPMPVRFALHQANLRSPVLQAQDTTDFLYHCWETFLMIPKQLVNADRVVNSLTFSLPQDVLQNLGIIAPPLTTGACETMSITKHTKTCRLRCVKWSGSDPLPDHTWAVSETSWIPYSYFTLNGTSLQQKKKKHYGKDRPIEITRLLREGDNVLEVVVISQTGDSTYRDYLVAVEVLGVMTHSLIQQQCRNNMRSKEQCLNDIKAKLSAGSDGDDDDDDLTVVESSLTISLLDPFTRSVIGGVPVRSAACRHHDCFDLATFLETRPRKNHVSVSDQWRCPVCNADARPGLLFVDGLMEAVRAQLSLEGLSQTRAIVVDQHGSWKPKAETRDAGSVRDNSPDADSPVPVQGAPPAPPIEIIDLVD